MSNLRRPPTAFAIPATIHVPNYATPSQAVAQAPPPPPPTLGATADGYEQNVVRIAWPTRSSMPTPVFKTSRRFRAIDVYITPTAANPISAANNECILTVRVFAIAAGIRSEVARGRVRFSTDAAGNLRERFTFPNWCVAARSSSAQYEVVIERRQAAVQADPTGDLQIAYVATDEMTEAPPHIGAIWANGVAESSDIVLGAAGLAQLQGPFEVLAITGTLDEAVAANRWLMLFDTLSTGNINGQAPIASWPMSSANMGVLGQPVVTPLRANLSPRLIVSSTGGSLTASGDGFCNMLIR